MKRNKKKELVGFGVSSQQLIIKIVETNSQVTIPYIKWVCPKCEKVNTDNYIETAAPICSDCDYYSDMWDDVLTPEQINNANKLLEM